MERSSLFSISISCPALNLKGTWVLQLAGQAADLVKQCLSQFLDVLRGSGMVTVEKQGDLSVGQVLNIVSDVYEIYEDSDQCNLSLQIRSIEVSLHWRVFLASGQEGHSAPARTSSFTSGFRNGRRS